MGAVFEWAGNFAKSLKANLNIADKAYVLTSSTVDPTQTATTGPVSSLFLRTLATINVTTAETGVSTLVPANLGKRGLVFTASTTAPITAASVQTGASSGGATGQLYMEIWSVSGGLPNTLLYQSNPVLASSLALSTGTVPFYFPETALLTSGVQYAMLFNASQASLGIITYQTNTVGAGFSPVSNGGGSASNFATTPGVFPAMSITQAQPSVGNIYQKQDTGNTTNWGLLATNVSFIGMELEAQLRDEWGFSPYALAAANIVAQQSASQISQFAGSGPASYDATTHTILFTNVGDQIVSANQLDANEFYAVSSSNNAFGDLSQVDLTVLWKAGAIDTAATYEMSRDGGVNYTAVTMQNAGLSTEAYTGTCVFNTEVASSTVNGTWTGFRQALDTGSNQAIAQPFTLSAASTLVSLAVQLHQDGTPPGNFFVQIWSSSGGAPQALMYSSQPYAANAVGAGEVTVTTTFNVSLAAGTYFAVIVTDSTYKASEVTGTTDIKWDLQGATNGYAFNGTTWVTSGTSYMINYTTTVPSYQTFVQQGQTSFSTGITTATPKVATNFVVGTGTGEVVQQVTLNLSKTGTPVGNLFVQIVKDSAGAPSTASSDIMMTSAAIPASSLSAGANTLVLPNTPLQAGTYWLVVYGDATYNASFGANFFSVLEQGGLATSLATATYNGTTWTSATSSSFQWVLSGRPLDLRIRITAGQTGKRLNAWRADYAFQSGVVGGTLKIQRFQVNSLTTTGQFTISQWQPDPNVLKMIHVESGLTYVQGIWTMQGSTVVFPANFFNPDGISRTVTLVADQTGGGSYAASDLNTQLLAASALGSTDPTISKASPGRGPMVQRPDGTLRMITIDNGDNIVVKATS